MNSLSDKTNEIDIYINQFPAEIQNLLQEIRSIIKMAAPMAIEVISYGMPAFKQKRILVYYAAHKKHIGLYPSGSGITAFAGELTGYQFSKGAIRFPLDKPLPNELIERIVLHRVMENELGK